MTNQEKINMNTITGTAPYKRTALTVDGTLYYVYQYDNDLFIDTIIRGPNGTIIDIYHPKYIQIGEAFVDSTPED